MQHMEAMSEAVNTLIDRYNCHDFQEPKVTLTSEYEGRKISIIADRDPEILEILRRVNIMRVFTSALYRITDKNINYYPLKLVVSFPDSCDNNFNELDWIVKKLSSAGINPVIVANNICWSTPKWTTSLKIKGEVNVQGVNSSGKWKVNGLARPDIHPSETIDLPENSSVDIEGPMTLHKFSVGETFCLIKNKYSFRSDNPIPDKILSGWQANIDRGASIPSESFRDVTE